MDHLQQIFTLSKRPVSFRINTLVSSEEEIENILTKNGIWYTKVSWLHTSYLLDIKYLEKDLWNLDIYKKWKIYLQWLASQLVVSLFTYWRSNNLKILDACAAPGWKTSQLASLYPEAEIYALEPNTIRYEKMCHNFQKLSCSQITTVKDSAQNIGKYIPEQEYFDIILIDAPCSSEWSLNFQNTKFLENWSEIHIKKNYKRQRQICDSVVPHLKTGWEMIYSTCTIAPEENEAIAHYLLCNYPELELQKLESPHKECFESMSPLTEFEWKTFKKEISEKSLRIVPNNWSEGFFVSKFRKL